MVPILASFKILFYRVSWFGLRFHFTHVTMELEEVPTYQGNVTLLRSSNLEFNSQ